MKAARRYDLDWLRVIAIILVLYFHVAMIFTAEWDWHIKNNELSNLWLEFNFWLSRFRMPLLFFISGVGTFFALRKRSAKQYLKERHNRLMIPLVFAMLFIVPPQIYFERLFEGQSFTSFFQFYPSVFELIPYPEGNLSWHHMWFVLYLFVYSAIGLPIFLYLKSTKGKQFINKALWLTKSSNIYVLLIPSILIYTFWTVHWDRTNDLIHDWGWLPYWFSFFLIGYFIASHNKFWESLERNRQTSLKLALICIVIVNVLRWNEMEPWSIWGSSWGEHWVSYIYLIILGLNGWAWLLTFIGYGKKYLNRNSSILSYANEGIYPFYILHQTVIIVIGFYVIQVEEGIFAKYAFISTLSFALTVAIYHFLIRPYKYTRFLFGMKPNLERQKKVDYSILENRGEFKAA